MLTKYKEKSDRQIKFIDRFYIMVFQFFTLENAWSLPQVVVFP